MEAEKPQIPLGAGWSTGLCTRESFADSVGVTVDTVNKWAERNYIPTVGVGRYRLVNTALLTRWLLEQEWHQ